MSLSRTICHLSILNTVFMTLTLCGCGPTVHPHSIEAMRPSRVPVETSGESRAKTVLAKLEAKYAQCHTYRDRGTVVYMTWGAEGLAHSQIARFDTLFVRDRGLRFRHFDERGTLLYGVWARGNDVREWFLGSTPASRGASIENSMSALKGVTGLASWIAFALLNGFPPVLSSTCEARYADALGCGDCIDVAFYCSSQGSAAVYTVDLQKDGLRHFSWLVEPSGTIDSAKGPGTSDAPIKAKPGTLSDSSVRSQLLRGETIILYDLSEIDVDQTAAEAELDEPAW
jgi:hypothetical protein